LNELSGAHAHVERVLLSGKVRLWIFELVEYGEAHRMRYSLQDLISTLQFPPDTVSDFRSIASLGATVVVCARGSQPMLLKLGWMAKLLGGWMRLPTSPTHGEAADRTNSCISQDRRKAVDRTDRRNALQKD
jgi:hypothetical protein